MVEVSVLIPSRDGEKTLPTTLHSLLNQQADVFITVANDASIDSTLQILEDFKDFGRVEYVTYPRREPKNYARVPALINLAREIAPVAEYYMVSGDDTFYPPDYIRKVCDYMKRDGVHIASGNDVRKPRKKTGSPSGSGRILTVKAWMELTPFPESIVWETGSLFKANMLGMKTAVYPMRMIHLRPYSVKSLWTFGHAAHILGIPLLITLGRVIKSIVRRKYSPLGSLSILLGQIEYILRKVKKADIAPYIRNNKYLQSAQKLKSFFVR